MRTHTRRDGTDGGTLSDMLVEETLGRLAARYGAGGVIPREKLGAALDFIRLTIEDVENSPSGPSGHNQLVLALVRQALTSRLGEMADYIDEALDGGRCAAIDDLRTGALPRRRKLKTQEA